MLRENNAGTPQGSILSPLLSNVALSVLDEHIARGPGGPATTGWQRAKRRRHGLPNYRISRYADDWCLMVHGTRADAEALREQAAEVLATVGLRLSQEKTLITHIDDGSNATGPRPRVPPGLVRLAPTPPGPRPPAPPPHTPRTHSMTICISPRSPTAVLMRLRLGPPR
jgi:hypothetical protein